MRAKKVVMAVLAMITILLSISKLTNGEPIAVENTRGVPSDVPYIRCETCKHLVKAAVNETNKITSETLTEVRLFDVVESLCDPSSPSGHWTKTIDMVERLRKIHLEAQPLEQACQQECRTLALACTSVVDGVESELAEYLYALRKAGEVDANVVEEWFCSKRGMSKACAERPPLFPKARPTGPPFDGKDPSKVQMEEMMERIKAQNQGMNVDMMSGGAKKDDVDDDDDDDDDDDNDGEDDGGDDDDGDDDDGGGDEGTANVGDIPDGEDIEVPKPDL